MITQYPDTAGHKATDTSAQAAAVATATAKVLREVCLQWLAGRDLTADECAAHMKKSVLSIRPRFSELAAQGKIFDSGERRKNESGHAAIVWTIKAQKELL